MNRIYHVIWNSVSASWVVVAESVSTRGKSRSGLVLPQSRSLWRQSWTRFPARDFIVRLLPLLVCTAWQQASAQPPAANALPKGGTVSAGQAAISQSGNQMQILQGTDKAALNWQSFDIGAAAGVRFQQPSTQAVALNRVAGNDPSQIFGSLNANGRVILINPNGVVFGARSRIDTAGLIATTKALSDADFMNDHYRFTGGGNGVVRNDGTVIAAPDGAILLVADKVINTGTIRVVGGIAGMFSADAIQVSADWNAADVTSAATSQRNTVTVENVGRIDVNGAQGGRIVFDGGLGTAQSDGVMLAIGSQGNGGRIHLSGTQVGLMGGSLTDASGASGGGEVLAGGDWQGSGSMQHALATYMDATAVVRVNAIAQGNGGRAVLWSDDYTNFRGQIQANGAGSGHGGMVETSAKNTLDATGVVMAQGSQGGTWLLDPTDVTITTAGTGTFTGNAYIPATSGTISNTAINTALNGGANVIIATSGGNDGNGVILQQAGADIDMAGAADSTLTLIADRIIDLQGNIGVSGTGRLNLDLDASGGTGLHTGAIIVRGDLATNGGNVSFRSGVMALNTAARSITTAGGTVIFDSDLKIRGPGLTIDTATGAANGGGAVTFGGKVDSADAYSFAAGTDWASLQADVTNGSGVNNGDTFMAQPLSDLENSVIIYTASFRTIGLAGTYSNASWHWVDGSHPNQPFNVNRDLVGAATLPNGETAYINWTANEPDTVNGTHIFLSADADGAWRAVLDTTPLEGTVVQQVANTSALTVDAGTGVISFGDRVGSIKPLSSLSVTGPTTIGGRQITTELSQIYNGPVTLANTATAMTSTADSILMHAPLSYDMVAAGSLTMRAAGDIRLDAAVTATTGALSVNFTADTADARTGSMAVNGISTNGGAITLTAGNGISLGNTALDTGPGAGGNITVLNRWVGDIDAGTGAGINAGAGGISITNGVSTGGNTGTGRIVLQDLSGAAITIMNRMIDFTAGQTAIALDGTIVSSGNVSVSSRSGGITASQDITTAGGNVSVSAGTNDTGTGTLTTNGISTNGGAIALTASNGIDIGTAALSSGGGAITLHNSRRGDIVATAGGVINAGTGNITVSNGDITVVNGEDVGIMGGGSITLDGLTGGTIAVSNNVIDVTTGNAAITFDGVVAGTGTVRATSMTGDIRVNAGMSSDANANLAAIVLAAGTNGAAADNSGGNVELNNIQLTINPASRAIIYTGSVDDSTGIGSAGTGYPGTGRYRYNVAYGDISRLPAGSTGVYVQYREQPTLTFNIAVPAKVYDGIAFDAQDWNSYTAPVGWKNDDSEAINALHGNLAFNGDTTTAVKDANTYTVGLGQLSDTLGYRLDISGTPTYEISARQITVSDLIVATRKYDSTTDALITGGIINGLVPGEENLVTLFGTHGVFEDKNVGVNKNVLVARVDLDGPGHHNYTVDFAGSTTTGTIEKAALTLTGIRPLDRVYDGTTHATFTGTPELKGIFASDQGKVSAPLDRITGRFENKNAGTNKEVVEDLSTAILSGEEAGNYELVGLDSSVNSATIFPAPLQLVGMSTIKMFDGKADAFTPAIVKGAMPGDSIGEVRQFFSSARPGKDKLLSISDDFVIQDGNDGNNYRIVIDDIPVTGEIRLIPAPNGMGANQCAPDPTNVDLLPASKVFADFRRKFEQANYFLHPGDEVRISSTHATAGKGR